MELSRPRYHHGALEAALLQEAVTQVRARGADQVSLRGLAQAVGVSPSAAYQHFPDKAALLFAVAGWSFDELARRMRAAMDAVTLDGDAAAIARFAAIGRAYVEFAAAEPHLFRHMFGALAWPKEPATPQVGADQECESVGEDAHALLLRSLDELSERNLLRPGAGVAEGLDFLAWSMVHGFSALLVEGHLTLEAGVPIITLFAQLVLRDEVLARVNVPEILAVPAG